MSNNPLRERFDTSIYHGNPDGHFVCVSRVGIDGELRDRLARFIARPARRRDNRARHRKRLRLARIRRRGWS